MEPIEGSETSTFKPQMPGKYPKENIILSRTTYPVTVHHIPEEGDPELYHCDNLKTCIDTFYLN
jgi:hypothetical protein